MDLVSEINDAHAQYFVRMSLRNACAVFYPEQRTQYRSQFVSREGVTAVLHGFSEYDLGYQRLSTVRPERARDRPGRPRATHSNMNDSFVESESSSARGRRVLGDTAPRPCA